MLPQPPGTVFARGPDGRQVLRTRPAGKWQIGDRDGRQTVCFDQAVAAAAAIRRQPGGVVFPDLAGGSRFYAALRRDDL